VSRLAVLRWFASFVPAPVTVRWTERVRSAVGALLGILFTGVTMRFVPDTLAAHIPLLVAPMGASAVLLFAVPASPLAQPWSILGGNLVAATVGVTCALLVDDPVVASALAVSIAIGGMFALRCVHPPSGAVALTAVIGGPAVHALGYRFVLEPILIQSVLLLAGALVYHAATGHRYPHAHRLPAAERAPTTAGFTRADIVAALRRQSELLDIDPEDIEAVLREMQLQAYTRTFQALTCADVMSQPVITATEGTTVPHALRLLERHHIKALPVIDDDRRVVGIVTRADLLGLTPRELGHSLRPCRNWCRCSPAPGTTTFRCSMPTAGWPASSPNRTWWAGCTARPPSGRRTRPECSASSLLTRSASRGTHRAARPRRQMPPGAGSPWPARARAPSAG
jgi:CBS domain-containing membrane protein